MKNCFLLIVFVVLAFTGYGQKCKYDFEKNDAFTGKAQKGTSTVLAGFGGMALRIAFQAEEKKFLVGLYLVLPGVNENWVEKGDTLHLALENGEVLFLRAVERYLPNKQIVVNNIVTFYTPMYAATEEQLKKISSMPMKATKINLGSQPLQTEIPPKNRDKIMRSAGCILN